MSSVILFNLVSVDGFFEGPDRDINWHTVDDEFDAFSVEQLNSASGLIFGRITYELMASYWPTPQAVEDDPEIAGKMNSLPKYVFSRSDRPVEWNNSRLFAGEAVDRLSQLKLSMEGNLLLFGSGDLAAAFLRHRLIDEIRLIVSPVLLGKGRRMFPEDGPQLGLKLAGVRKFQNGNVLMSYSLI